MGRPKNYERADVTRKAMEVFWMHGYGGASTSMLTDAMGLNRFSLFAEFESKQGLFEAAIDLYLQDIVECHFGRLHAPEAGLDDVETVLKFFAKHAKGPISAQGCLLTNVATERAPHDPPSNDVVQAYLKRIATGFEKALHTAKKRGELAAKTEVRNEARLLTSALLGVFVLMRAETEPAFARGAIRAALLHLATLRVDDDG